MSLEHDSTIWIERRRFHRLRRISKFRVTIQPRPDTKISAEGDNVQGAWAALVAYADRLGNVKITSPCPWDEKGNLR